MSHTDDKLNFEAERRANSLALGADAEAFRASVDAVLAADKHRYAYLWSFMGVPIIQMPADIAALQEVIWETKPDIIIETGVARGGSLVFSAAMLTLIGKGKVIGIDIDIRAHNRDTIEKHPMASRITLIEGSSVDPETIARVRSHIPEGSRVMVVLDSDHSYDHVAKELELYHELVTSGQYLIVADTLLGYLSKEETPTERSHVWHRGNEPLTAVKDFLAKNTSFEQDPVLNGKLILSSSTGGYLRKLKD